MSNALNTNIRSTSKSPFLIKNFSASVACMVPNIPATEPNTPACEQVGTALSGGGQGKKQR
jgi:hypothetical protein